MDTMLFVLLLLIIPCAFGFNCSSSEIEEWCICTDIEGGRLNLTCNNHDIPNLLPDSTVELHITGNNFTNLIANFLKKPMPQLEVLDLQGNEIMYVDTDAFVRTDFKVLEVLVLDNNKLMTFSGSKLISKLNSLKSLSMKNAFYNASSATYVGSLIRKSRIEKLESIMLDNNDFSRGLLPTTFNFSLNGKERKTYIKHISLRNISLEILFPGTLNQTHLPNLLYVDLRDNELQTIDKDVINDLKQFLNLTIDFSGNPFICNCRLYDFVTWWNETEFVHLKNNETYTCSNDSPKKNVGRRVVDLNPDDDLKYYCYDIDTEDINEILYPSYIALSIVFGIIALLAVVILFLRRGEIVGFFQRMFNVAHDTLSDKGGYTDMDNPYVPETPAVDV